MAANIIEKSAQDHIELLQFHFTFALVNNPFDNQHDDENLQRQEGQTAHEVKKQGMSVAEDQKDDAVEDAESRTHPIESQAIKENFLVFIYLTFLDIW